MRASPVLVALPDGLDALIELIVEHDFRVAGTVVDAAGEPISDAIVHFQHAVPASYRPPTAVPTATLEPLAAGEVRADASGGFVVSGLGPGDVELLARAPGASTGRAAAPVMASVRVRAGDEHVVLALPAPARIRGRVLAAPGRPATELEVSLVQRGGTVRVADPDGRFELADIDPTPGSYRVSVAAAGAAARTLEVRVAPGQTTDLGTVTLESGRTLRGRVLDPAGVAVGGAVISVDDASGARIAQSRSDELGGFELAVPNATLTVHATVAGVGSSRFEAVPPGRGAIELHLPETGRLEVTITGSAADGPLTVSAKRADAPDGGFRIFVLDRDPGTSTFHADVSQGDYVVRAAPGEDLRVVHRATPNEVAVAVAVGQVQRLEMTVERPTPSRP
jgi:protocatechuate 3,4-dioxygenase beta subunit